jgi:hypothetical protein
MSNNPFATEEAWEVSTGDLIPVGDFVVEIDTIDGTGKSSGNYPQIELEVKNPSDGKTRKDWITISQNTIGKVVQLTKAAGAGTPPDEAVDADTYRISQQWLTANLKGKRVGIIVREREKYNEPGKFRPEIVGYVTPDKIDASDVTSPGDTASVALGDESKSADETIPF